MSGTLYVCYCGIKRPRLDCGPLSCPAAQAAPPRGTIEDYERSHPLPRRRTMREVVATLDGEQERLPEAADYERMADVDDYTRRRAGEQG